ncbi:unnamed protein product, partial [Hapterophycus canaliculatus]
GREFACRSEERLHRISQWRRDKLAALSSAGEQDESAALTSSVKEALGEILEFVSNPDNLWVVTREMLAAVALHIRAPGSETDEAPVLAACILWKLSEYEDFVLPLLKADAVSACAAAVEQLGPPRAGALQYWLQAAVQTRAIGLLCRAGCAGSVDATVRLRVASALIAVVARPWGALEARKEYREGVEGKTLSFASFGLRHLVATSISIRGSIAQRSSLFDALLSAIRPRAGATGVGGKSGLGASPPQAMACAAFCLAHVTTGESAALLTRRKIVAALLTLSGLLDACIDQMEATIQPVQGCDAAHESNTSSGAGLIPSSVSNGGTTEEARDGSGSTLSLVESTGTALWGCLSHLSEATCEEDTTSNSLVDSCSSDTSVGSFDLPDASSGGGDCGGGVSVDAGSQASDFPKVRRAITNIFRFFAAVGIPSVRAEGGFDSGDGKPDKPLMSTRKVLSICALPLLRLLSHATRHHVPAGSGSSNDSSNDRSVMGNVCGNDVGVGATTEALGSKGGGDDTPTDDSIIDTVVKKTDNTGGGVPESIIAIIGSCLSHVAQEIDLVAEPPSAMESVLVLLLPSAGQLVREQVALTLGAIAGQGLHTRTEFCDAEKAARQFSRSGGCSAFGREGSSDYMSLPKPGEGGRQGKRLLLWRQFCAGLVKGSGAQVILDCASPGPVSDPNSLLLRERAGRALSLICLCAGSTPASSVVLGGLVSLLRCREGEVVSGAATAALWALCRVPENRRCFAKMRVVSCLTPLCEWSRDQDYQQLHLYCLATLYLLSQEPENALQISNQKGSIAKLVMWATPSQAYGDSEGVPRLVCPNDNAKTASCLGVIRRQEESAPDGNGMRELADGLASYSMLHLVLHLLGVRVKDKSVLPLTLREAQGILFAVQDRAEYRGYCEQICGRDPFSVEDTLALQLKRHVEASPSAQYADLAGDAVVGLASLSMTLVSRRRLAVNGALESTGRMLARSMSHGIGGGGCSGGSIGMKGRKGGREAVRNLIKLVKNLSSVPEAHRRLSGRPLLTLINRLWEESPDETTSKFACHALANLSRSDVPGVRNRLFQSHLAAESTGMVRGTSTANGDGVDPAPASASREHLSPTAPRNVIVPRAATAVQCGSSDGDDGTLSISSSVFRRDHVGERGRLKGGETAHSTSVVLSEELARRNARLDTQHRLRLMPAALWGDRARNFDAGHHGNKGDTAATHIAAQEQQETFLTAVRGAGTAVRATVGAAGGSAFGTEKGPATQKKSNRRMQTNINSLGVGGGGGKKRAIAIMRESSLVQPEGTRGVTASTGGVALPADANCSQAASLKRPAVDSSVPLRWQSRVVALSSLRDTFTTGAATRRSPSMGRRMARTRCRAYQHIKKRR